MKRSIPDLLFVLLGFAASAILDGIPRQLSFVRMEQADFFYLRWVNVALDLLYAAIVLFILWWTVIKNKPGKAVSIVFVVFGLAMILLGSMAFYVLPENVLHLLRLPALFLKFHGFTCAPNNVYFLVYSGVTVLIGLGGLITLKLHVIKNSLSFPVVLAGLILSYGVDLVHQAAFVQTTQGRTNFLLIFPVEGLLFAGIIMVIVWRLLKFTRPVKSTLILSLTLGVVLLLYKTSFLSGLPRLMPLWYARQQVHSVCSPFSFAVTYGGFIVVVALTGLFRPSVTPQPDAPPLELS